jgi:arylsulfatase A-like enzyme
MPTSLKMERKFRTSNIIKNLNNHSLYRIFLNVISKGIKEVVGKSYYTVRHHQEWRDAETLNINIKNIVEDEKIKKPYFLWIHYIDSHWPYKPKEKSDKHKRMMKNINDVYSNNRLNKLSKEELDYALKLYKKELKYTDEKIFELLEYLTSKGLMDNTLIIVTADHGEGFHQDGGIRHGLHLWDEVVRVPLIIYGLNMKGVIKGQKGLLDLPPTILEILGFPKEIKFLGSSMLEGGSKQVLMKAKDGTLGIRTNEWKFIYPDKLFDLNIDPEERNNLSEKYPAIVKTFQNNIGRVGSKMT